MHWLAIGGGRRAPLRLRRLCAGPSDGAYATIDSAMTHVAMGLVGDNRGVNTRGVF